MKKMKNILKPCLLTYLRLLCVFANIGFADTPADSSLKKVEVDYILSDYVIGSGGIIGDTSTNYRHNAAVGESCAGRIQGTNYILLIGFWRSLENETPVAIDQSPSDILPKEFKLHQNYPNPFNPETTVEYDLPARCLVKIDIFNIMGQRIRTLNSKIQNPGYGQVHWDGRDENNKIVSSGVYFYQLIISSVEGKNILFQQTKKMLLIK